MKGKRLVQGRYKSKDKGKPPFTNCIEIRSICTCVTYVVCTAA